MDSSEEKKYEEVKKALLRQPSDRFRVHLRKLVNEYIEAQSRITRWFMGISSAIFVIASISVSIMVLRLDNRMRSLSGEINILYEEVDSLEYGISEITSEIGSMEGSTRELSSSLDTVSRKLESIQLEMDSIAASDLGKLAGMVGQSNEWDSLTANSIDSISAQLTDIRTQARRQSELGSVLADSIHSISTQLTQVQMQVNSTQEIIASIIAEYEMGLQSINDRADSSLSSLRAELIDSIRVAESEIQSELGEQQMSVDSMGLHIDTLSQESALLWEEFDSLKSYFAPLVRVSAYLNRINTIVND